MFLDRPASVVDDGNARRRQRHSAVPCVGVSHHVGHRFTQDPAEQFAVSQWNDVGIRRQLDVDGGGHQSCSCACQFGADVDLPHAADGAANVGQCLPCKGFHLGDLDSCSGSIDLEQSAGQFTLDSDDGQGMPENVVHVSAHPLTFGDDGQIRQLLPRHGQFVVALEDLGDTPRGGRADQQLKREKVVGLPGRDDPRCHFDGHHHHRDQRPCLPNRQRHHRQHRDVDRCTESGGSDQRAHRRGQGQHCRERDPGLPYRQRVSAAVTVAKAPEGGREHDSEPDDRGDTEDPCRHRLQRQNLVQRIDQVDQPDGSEHPAVPPDPALGEVGGERGHVAHGISVGDTIGGFRVRHAWCLSGTAAPLLR